MTTDDMARDIGRTRRTISNYESDSTQAPLLVLRQYAIRTGVPLVWIQCGDSDGDGGSTATSPATSRETASNTDNVLRIAA